MKEILMIGWPFIFIMLAGIITYLSLPKYKNPLPEELHKIDSENTEHQQDTSLFKDPYKDENIIYKAFSTLLHSWGSDTPSEAIWAANEFLEILALQYIELKGLEFYEIGSIDAAENNERIMEVISNLKIQPCQTQ